MIIFQLWVRGAREPLGHHKSAALPPVGMRFLFGESRMYEVVEVSGVVGEQPGRFDSGPGAVPELKYVVYVEAR